MREIRAGVRRLLRLPLRTAAQEKSLKVYQFPNLKGPEAIQAMKDANADIGIMAYVLQFAPQEFVNIPKHGTIQYHPSLLPKYRGPSSINWPISLGEKKTGLTIFRPTDGLDEGPVVLQRSCTIGADETLGEVYFNKLFPMGVSALLEAADLVVNSRHEERVQDERHATYEGWVQDEEARIHWNGHVDVAYNLIRACNPAPGAWTLLDGVKVRFYECRKHVVGRFVAAGHKPGDVAGVTERSIVIWAHGGLIEVFRLRPEGGGKMDAGDYARQRGLPVSTAWQSYLRPA